MRKADGFNQERTFGVEVEFFNTTPQAVVDAIQAKGIDAYFAGYTHETSRQWKVVTDASVTSRGTGMGRGLELVSPILRGTEGLEELRIVLEALNETSAEVDRSCGVHVHHDADDFDIKAFTNLYGIYSRFEGSIDELFPLSRRDDRNTYCRSIKDKTHLDAFAECNTLADLADYLEGRTYDSYRYYKLNIASYRRHGTVEFRQHSGSTDYEKISSWIVLSQAMVEKAVNSRVAMKQGADDWFNFKKVIRGYKWMGADELTVDAIKFFNKRRRELAKKFDLELA
jgi:hypothetical protein